MSHTFTELEKKEGPFPVWVYGGLFALVLIVYLRHRSATSAAANAATAAATADPNAAAGVGSSTDPATDTGTVSDADPFSQAADNYLLQDATNPAFPVSLTQQGTPAPVTNAQWTRLAADALIAKGDVPTEVESALAKYLQGSQLSQTDEAVVNQALTSFGSPPEGLIAENPPTAAPSGPSYYTVKAGDTWASIAKSQGQNLNTLVTMNSRNAANVGFNGQEPGGRVEGHMFPLKTGYVLRIR